mgnify:CR=1 FL=1
MELPTATAKMRGPDGITRVGVSTGTGPVDAAIKAIDSLVQAPCLLVDYSMNSVSDGIDALAVTRVLIEPAGSLKDLLRVRTAQGSS